MTADPQSPWYATDHEMILATRKDRAVAREMNADWMLVNAEPFGTPRRVLP